MAKNTRELAPRDVIIAEDALMNFQFAVIKAMRDQKVSKAQLAEKLGITRARMSQMLSPDANPTLKNVGRVLDALDLDTKYLNKSAPSMGFGLDTKIEITQSATHKALSGEWTSIPGSSSLLVWHNDNKRMTAKSDEPIAA